MTAHAVPPPRVRDVIPAGHPQPYGLSLTNPPSILQTAQIAMRAARRASLHYGRLARQSIRAHGHGSRQAALAMNTWAAHDNARIDSELVVEALTSGGAS